MQKEREKEYNIVYRKERKEERMTKIKQVERKYGKNGRQKVSWEPVLQNDVK